MDLVVKAGTAAAGQKRLCCSAPLTARAQAQAQWDEWPQHLTAHQEVWRTNPRPLIPARLGTRSSLRQVECSAGRSVLSDRRDRLRSGFGLRDHAGLVVSSSPPTPPPVGLQTPLLLSWSSVKLREAPGTSTLTAMGCCGSTEVSAAWFGSARSGTVLVLLSVSFSRAPVCVYFVTVKGKPVPGTRAGRARIRASSTFNPISSSREQAGNRGLWAAPLRSLRP